MVSLVRRTSDRIWSTTTTSHDSREPTRHHIGGKQQMHRSRVEFHSCYSRKYGGVDQEGTADVNHHSVTLVRSEGENPSLGLQIVAVANNAIIQELNPLRMVVHLQHKQEKILNEVMFYYPSIENKFLCIRLTSTH